MHRKRLVRVPRAQGQVDRHGQDAGGRHEGRQQHTGQRPERPIKVLSIFFHPLEVTLA